MIGAGAIFALSPTMIAHGSLVKSELIVALGAVIVTTAALPFVRRPSAAGGALAGGACGLAMMLKFSILLLLPGVGLPVSTPSDVVGDCLETDLYDAQTNRIIGTGLDCLNILDGGDAGISIDRTTIFNFPQGRLVARGLTTVVPIFGSSSPGFTHVVGDVDDATDNIVSGTGRFKNASGNVRLSGIVNLADLPTTLRFNCVFVIDMD